MVTRYVGNTAVSDEEFQGLVKRGYNEAPTLRPATVEKQQTADVLSEGGFGATPHTPTVRRHTGEDSVLAGLDTTPLSPAEEEVRRQRVSNQVQTQIDAITAEIAQRRSRVQQVGTEREERTRSYESNKGLAGSPRGDAKRNQAEDLTSQELAVIDKERTARIAAVNDKMSAQAEAEIAAENEKVQGNIEKFMSMMDGVRKNTLDLVKEYGKGGARLEDLSPATRQSLLERGGFTDESDLEYYLNASRPTADQIKYETKIAGNKIFSFGVDPRTGEIKTIEKEIPTEIASQLGEGWKPHVVEGELWAFNEQDGTAKKIGGPGKAAKVLSVEEAKKLGVPYGTTEEQAAKMKITPQDDTKPATNDLAEYEYAKKQGYTGTFLEWQKLAANLKEKASGAGAGTATERTANLKAQAIKKARPALDASRKGGKYVDGNEYLKLRTDYAQAIGNPKDFDESFAALLAPSDPIRKQIEKEIKETKKTTTGPYTEE